MLKVKKIIEIKDFAVVCEFDNGSKKKLDVLPLLKNHKHLNGIEKLQNNTIFNQVAIGDMGEIYWKNIITSKSNELWNYDISPEFIFYNGIAIDLKS